MTSSNTSRFKNILCALSAVMILSACASSEDTRYGQVYDPFEDSNRAVFAFNQVLDENVAEPIAKGYRIIMPEPGREGIKNVLQNLSTPVNAGNQLLQGDFEGALTDIGRALVNTTVGVAGLFDVAGYFGYKHEPEDFGQTLAVWGFSEGPYFVIPVLGPSNLRDGTGRLADSLADPLNIYLQNIEEEEIIYARWGVSLLSQRTDLLDVLDELEANAIDYYAVMRSSYTQYRTNLINDQDGSMGSVAIPDFDEE